MQLGAGWAVPTRQNERAAGERVLAGRQGFELGARSVSNVVMARDFWCQALQSQAVTSLRFVHCRPPDSCRFSPNRGDILETLIGLIRMFGLPPSGAAFAAR